MYTSLLLCFTVIASAANASDIITEDDVLEEPCNPDIPIERNVTFGEECRTSENCQRKDPFTDCVQIKDKYCECQDVEHAEDRKRWQRRRKRLMKKLERKKNKLCKNREGHSCTKKFKCGKKYRKRRKRCRHPRHVCCTKCKNIDGAECIPIGTCSAMVEKSHYQCLSKKHVCCGPTKKEFSLHDVSLSWDDAKSYCEDLGGTLAMIKNGSDAQMISELVANNLEFNGPRYWIGAQADGVRSWKLIDGTSFAHNLYNTFYLSSAKHLYWSDIDDSPSPDSRDCLAIFNFNIPGIDDFDCSEEKGAVCQAYVPA